MQSINLLLSVSLALKFSHMFKINTTLLRNLKAKQSARAPVKIFPLWVCVKSHFNSTR